MGSRPQSRRITWQPHSLYSQIVCSRIMSTYLGKSHLKPSDLFLALGATITRIWVLGRMQSSLPLNHAAKIFKVSLTFVIFWTEPFELAKKMQVPGPGQYKTIEISADGKYCLSTVPNSKASVWSPAKNNRFKDDSRLGHPEPATYNPSDTHSLNDSYILSTMKNAGVKRISPVK